MAPTCFGLRPSSGSLQLSLAEVILILKHLVASVVICYVVVWQHVPVWRVYYVLCTAHRTHITLGRAAAPPNNNLTECLNINITSARLNCKLPDDGRRQKQVGAI